MGLPRDMFRGLRLPVIGSPMFIVSGPELVLAQCRAGIVGTMPSLSIRHAEELEPALAGIRNALKAEGKDVPFGINLIVHRTNARLDHDLDACVRQEVPVIITSLGPSRRIVERVHGYGGLVLHDVTNLRHAAKAIGEGVDGLIAVCAGAGGHSGALNPFAFVSELRQQFDGLIVLGGSISSGRDIVAARALGADLVYMGTRFIATQEATAPGAQKQMIVASRTADIVTSSYFTGVSGNYLAPSIAAAGLDPLQVAGSAGAGMKFSDSGSKAKVWKDIWSAGHGVAAISDVPAVAELVDRLDAECAEALQALNRPRAASG
ncbi:nitronate monooxygenase [Pseudooceanicola sp. 216_PA32_1]|uniref:Nitronate monooxygenase n=1 Tax=Pseudooceanicola pacificus TaxID=2676438 RepID=A0A844WAQ3_9RHOB|nr:nitronate monooxygenase [Pseudooceanicola pacificus]MWB78103.1 nitronate monooxygenase [Pseudooceanicola pacificus]